MRTTLSLVLAMLVSAAVSLASADAGKGPEARLLVRVLKLLPERPAVPIRVIDPDLAADPDAVRRLDAFLVREKDGKLREVIYLNRRAAVFENALGGKDIDLAILAAVVRHELEHLRGAAEPEARKAERAFFQALVFRGRVPVSEGLAYLAALEHGRQIREGS